ncbi:MAG: hypothetical protein SFY96_06285, partial [Planctomycetota bacterium]|nr:hypothetical protein [Planctomycetota bacterium]
MNDTMRLDVTRITLGAAVLSGLALLATPGLARAVDTAQPPAAASSASPASSTSQLSEDMNFAKRLSRAFQSVAAKLEPS